MSSITAVYMHKMNDIISEISSGSIDNFVVFEVDDKVLYL